MLRQYRRLLILLAILTVAVLAAAQQGHLQPGLLGRVVPELVRPFQVVLTAGTRQVQEAAAWVEAARLLAEERRNEERDLHELEQLRLEVGLLAAENNRLRRLLGLAERLSADDPVGVVTFAEVIGRNPDTWFQMITLDKGSRDGVQPGMAVVVPPKAAVGRIVQTTTRTSQAMLLLDPDSAVGAVLEETGEAGVVFAMPGHDRQLVMRFFDPDARVQPNRLVVTSGSARDYPRGLLVGVIAQVRQNPATGGVEAVLLPVANFNRLEEVMIVQRPGTPEPDELPEAGDGPPATEDAGGEAGGADGE